MQAPADPLTAGNPVASGEQAINARSPEARVFVPQPDAPIVDWARLQGYPFYYAAEAGLPDPCLKVHLGQLCACFHDGRLVRMTLQVDGDLIQDACDQLRRLLAICSLTGACPPQQPGWPSIERAVLCASPN